MRVNGIKRRESSKEVEKLGNEFPTSPGKLLYVPGTVQARSLDIFQASIGDSFAITLDTVICRLPSSQPSEINRKYLLNYYGIVYK